MSTQNSTGKKVGAAVAVLGAAALIAFGVYMVDVEQTEEASLPNVNITADGGNLPEFDAEVGDVNVGEEDVTVTVPTINIESPEEEDARIAENN